MTSVVRRFIRGQIVRDLDLVVHAPETLTVRITQKPDLSTIYLTLAVVRLQLVSFPLDRSSVIRLFSTLVN